MGDHQRRKTMASMTASLHATDGEPIKVAHSTYDSTHTKTPYVALEVGPLHLFIGDPLVLMELVAECSAAFNELSTAIREAGGQDWGATTGRVGRSDSWDERFEHEGDKFDPSDESLPDGELI